MTHLSTLELAQEVERVAGLSSPDEREAHIAAHLHDCALCRDRVSRLHDQDIQLARALEAHAGETAPELDVSDQVAAMMKRLRADVAAARQAKERQVAAPAVGVAQEQQDAAARSRGRARPRVATVGVLSFAAGVGFALLVPALRRTVSPPGPSTVAVIPARQEAIRDSVPGFEGKQYTQKVSAGSGINVVVQGLNGTDFDCELYDAQQVKPVAVDNGIQNACRFSMVVSEAGEYRLVVKNRMGAATSYMMVAQVMSNVPRGASRPNDSSSIVSEPLHQVQ